MFSTESIFREFLEEKSKLQSLPLVSDSTVYELIRDKGFKSQDLHIVLEELLMNAEEHGATPIQLLYDVGQSISTFLLCDQGMGIHQTIPRNKRLSDLEGKSSSSIIRLSLEEGITGTGQIGRGMGLYLLSKFIFQNSGEALVACNSGLVVQKCDFFEARTLKEDIKKNIILFQIANTSVGL